MEVDLLCAPACLAIELDGGQHLSNVEAYRRDRRKDMLLRKMAISLYVSWPKTLESVSTKCWMPS